MKKALLVFSRTLIGLVFVFSGFVKCVDPLGTAYKFEDYFIAFGWNGLLPMTLAFSLILCGAELLIGLMLLFNVATRIASLLGLIFYAIFLPLTLYLAISNPVSDCGCFGDALIMTNWETFLKNLVLTPLAVIVFLKRKSFREWIGPLGESIAVLIVAGGIGFFEYSNLANLPIIDFRPYQIGTNIPESMKIPEGAQVDEYDMVFIYQKDGKKQEFRDLNNLPGEPWEWVDTRTTLTTKGYEPPIHDFSIVTQDGFDITEDVLHAPNPVFLVISYDLLKANTGTVQQMDDISLFAMERGAEFIVLTSSLSSQIAEFKERNDLNWTFCTTDQTTLKTIIRSNPGLMLIKNGIILNKWHHRHLPDLDELKSDVPNIR